MLKQLVYRLRAKIEPDPAQPRFIETVPGVGYGLINEGSER
jgi:DNA-binding response OmpR family regulator